MYLTRFSSHKLFDLFHLHIYIIFLSHLMPFIWLNCFIVDDQHLSVGCWEGKTAFLCLWPHSQSRTSGIAAGPAPVPSWCLDHAAVSQVLWHRITEYVSTFFWQDSFQWRSQSQYSFIRTLHPSEKPNLFLFTFQVLQSTVLFFWHRFEFDTQNW